MKDAYVARREDLRCVFFFFCVCLFVFFSGLTSQTHTRILKRGLLGRSSFHFPHIVDVDWRLDYHMKSRFFSYFFHPSLLFNLSPLSLSLFYSKVEKIDEPIWYITLKTVTDEGEHRDVQFTCNREEMQQFLAKVKDADSASRMFE